MEPSLVKKKILLPLDLTFTGQNINMYLLCNDGCTALADLCIMNFRRLRICSMVNPSLIYTVAFLYQ